MKNKSRLLALLLTLLPGLGHFYLGRERKAILYIVGFIMPTLLGVMLAIFVHADEPFLSALMVSAFVFFIAFLDMLITILRMSPKTKVQYEQIEQANQTIEDSEETEMEKDRRFKTFILALIPGLGHLHVGLMQRGLSFLIGFFGIAMMVIFLTTATQLGGFTVFLGFLPVIWIYNLFDIAQQLNRKEKGRRLEDVSILEDIERFRETERKSKTIASLLSFIPGVGHLYLGLQKRGIQLLATFFIAIYILDILRLSVFMFLIPIIWFYSFFDALQQVSKKSEEREDIPVFTYFANHQRWIGIGLLVLGAYYMIDSVVVPALDPYLFETFNINLSLWYGNYFQTTIVCILLIGGGLRLLAGSKEKKEEKSV